MAKNLREAALWELVMQSAHDVHGQGPPFESMNGSLISLDATLTRAAEAANEDYPYGFALHVCLVAGICYKILFDLTSESDIQKMLTEAKDFKDKIHDN